MSYYIPFIPVFIDFIKSSFNSLFISSKNCISKPFFLDTNGLPTIYLGYRTPLSFLASFLNTNDILELSSTLYFLHLSIDLLLFLSAITHNPSLLLVYGVLSLFNTLADKSSTSILILFNISFVGSFLILTTTLDSIIINLHKHI